MKKNIYKLFRYLPSIFLFILFIFIFIFQNDVKDSVIFSISIWKDNLIPSMYPFLLVSELLINYDFLDILSKVVGPFISLFFNVPKYASYGIITSFFSGFPSGSKYVVDLLYNSKISLNDANYLIMFTHFPNPLFVTSFIGSYLLNSKSHGYVILLSVIISNLIISIIFRPKKKVIINTKIKENKDNRNFTKSLTQASLNSFKILLNMLGIIMFFLIIITILFKVINLPLYVKIFTSSVLEMTNGIRIIALSNLNMNIKCALISSSISFSGLSVHMQVKSIIDSTKIKYKYFLLSRIIGSILSFLITYCYLLFF